MKKILYLFFSRDVVAGDDDKITPREIAVAWFIILAIALTIVGAVLAFMQKLSSDFITLLITEYSMTVTLLGISSGKSSFNRFVNAKYEGKDNSATKHSTY